MFKIKKLKIFKLMKKTIIKLSIITLIFFILFNLSHNSLKAQTLQFSQVLILNNGTQYTVPTNKVWKIESAVYNSYYISYSSSSSKAIVNINGTDVWLIPFSFYDGNNYGRAPVSTAFPMWLPEGTTITPSSGTSKMFAIEFTVVP